MILSGASRFGLLLAGARWRWLVAALVASLVSVLVSVPVADATAPIERAPSVGASQHGPLARPASLQAQLAGRLAIIILTELSKSQLPGSAGLGRLLQFVVEDKPQPDIAGVKKQLAEIQSRLAALQEEVTELKADVAQSEYSVLVNGTTELTSAIDTGMDELENVATIPPGDPGLKRYTEGALDRIKKNLIDKPAQQDLTQKIAGVAGSDGLIKAFSKAVKSRSGYWTKFSSQQVREVFDYWQAEESRLLALRVNYMNSHPLEFPQVVIERAIKKVEEEVGTPEKNGVPAALGTQEALLKPSVPFDVFADTRTNLEWGYHDLGAGALTYAEAKDEIKNYSGGWRLPDVSEVQGLIAGYPGYGAPEYQNWGTWLNNQLGGLLTGRQPFSVWVYSPRCSTALDSCSYINFTGKESKTEINYLPNQVLLVRERTQTYWW